jgi:hypothetical protein
MLGFLWEVWFVWFVSPSPGPGMNWRRWLAWGALIVVFAAISWFFTQLLAYPR